MVTNRTVTKRRPAKAVSSRKTATESPGVRAALTAAGTSGSAGAASLKLKSTLEKLEEDRPVLFISLHRVLVRVANENASDYRSAASELLTLIENESDFPTWYKYKPSRPKSKGEEDMIAGPRWGKRVLEHAERSGEPVEYGPTFAYGHDFYEIPNPPDPIYSFIRGETTVFGFQLAEIEPFLTRHGIKGFGLGHAVERKDAGAANKVSARGVPPQRAQEVAILAALHVRGHDPKALARAPMGNKPWPLRVDIRDELKLSKETMRKAWKRLRKDKRIQDA